MTIPRYFLLIALPLFMNCAVNGQRSLSLKLSDTLDTAIFKAGYMVEVVQGQKERKRNINLFFPHDSVPDLSCEDDISEMVKKGGVFINIFPSVWSWAINLNPDRKLHMSYPDTLGEFHCEKWSMVVQPVMIVYTGEKRGEYQEFKKEFWQSRLTPPLSMVSGIADDRTIRFRRVLLLVPLEERRR